MLIQKAAGQVIVQLRRKIGKNRADIGRETGLDYRYLQRLEKGEHMPSMATLLLLAAALETTPDRLIMPVWDEWIKAGQPDIKKYSSIEDES